ncbi:MAG: ribonuclease G [Candidatus Azotimanducaceae bacterium]
MEYFLLSQNKSHNKDKIQMGEEIIVSVSPLETRVAVVEQGLLQEIFIERVHARVTVGNIYQGKVSRILPGIQSAFVDIGQEKAAFMHITDLIDPQFRFDSLTETSERKYPPIQDVLRDGQSLMVQVTKEPISTKGPRATSSVSIASRFLVYTPNSNHVGISQRIEDEAERQRLSDLLATICVPETSDGFIVRTACERASEEEILRDAELLREKWGKIQAQGKLAKPATLVYEDLPMHLRAMRDIINRDTQRILVDNRSVFGAMERFLTDFIPEKVENLELVSLEVPLFDAHNLEDQIENALDRNVLLKSGGYLVVDQTEAMTTVDVNTGAFVGKKDVDETIFRMNLEAAAAIPRQLRLRNIGGIVIIDFIDMINEEHKRQVLRMLEKGQQADRVKWNIAEISELGLVEMTRKRTQESLLRRICAPCAACNGRGFLKSPETVCLEIYREIQRKFRRLYEKGCQVRASQSVIDRLLDEDSENVSELSKMLKADIRLQVETSYTQEQFDVVLSITS